MITKDGLVHADKQHCFGSKIVDNIIVNPYLSVVLHQLSRIDCHTITTELIAIQLRVTTTVPREKQVKD